MRDDPQAIVHPTIRLSEYRPPDWLVPEVRLRFELDRERTLVHATLTCTRNGAHDRPLRLDGDALETLSVAVDGVPSNAPTDGPVLELAVHGDAATVEIVTALNPAANTRLMGLYASGEALVTQCEAEGFRRITWFPDRPDVLSVYDVRLEADAAKYPVLLANGDPGAAGALPEGRRYAEWRDPWPKPAYLFALVAGDLKALEDRFTTMSRRDVALNIWTAAADVPRCRHAMDALKASMAWDERVYGREYDLSVFNIVAVHDFNAGAMENKGLNIFNAKYILADHMSATDWDMDGVAGVVAHEYFHNWSGNRVTCRDWFQLSLKEGFTVLRDQQFMADEGSPAVKRIEEVRGLRAGQFPEDAGPLSHPVRPDSYVEIGNFYTSTVYNKGAELCRMLLTRLGPEAFRRSTDRYFAANDGRAATVEDFLAAFAPEGIDVEAQLRWYRTRGTPRVTARLEDDGGRAVVRLAQSNAKSPDAPPVPIPLRVARFDRGSGARIGEEALLLLEEREQLFALGDAAEAVLSVNRGFSAPVTVDAGHTPADLAFLAAHDDDPVNRWDALQALMRDTILADIAAGTPGDHTAVVDAVAALLERAGDDPAFVGEAAILPSEALIGDAMAAVDPDAIHQAREALRRSVSDALAPRWWTLFHDCAAAGAEPGGRAKGQRRLRGVALGYLMSRDDHEATAAAFLMFLDAPTMTDRMAALGVLANSKAVERDDALAMFLEKHGGDPALVDKWFSVQAMSARADTLERVRALEAHPLFDARNPNRLRALVMGFTANQLRFHAADGSGYDFLADQVIAADAINPASSSRLVLPLTRWQRFEPGRRTLMRDALERLAARNNSRDLAEIFSNSLKDA